MARGMVWDTRNIGSMVKFCGYIDNTEKNYGNMDDSSCYNGILFEIPSGELTFCHGKSPFFMGKSTISMAIFHSFLIVHQRVPIL